MQFNWEAWIHPQNGGDDMIITGKTVITGNNLNKEIETKNVNKAIVRILKRRKSKRIDDYRIIEIIE